MQDGAGTTGLTGLFNTIISDDDYKKRSQQIQKTDQVVIRSKESASLL